MTLKLVSNTEQLKCNGVGRDAEHDRALCFYFNRPVTDEEMRWLHEVMQRSAFLSKTAAKSLTAMTVRDRG